MLQTLQCRFAAHCSPNYTNLPYVNDTTTRPTCRVSSWRLMCKAKKSSSRTRLEQTLNPQSSNSGFLTFRLSMLSAIFLLFCFSLSVQKFDLSTWSLMCALCIRTISVCLLRLNIRGNEWSSFHWSQLRSSLASNAFDIGRVKGNFVDEPGKSYRIGRNFVCARRERTQLKLIHVVDGRCWVKRIWG